MAKVCFCLSPPPSQWLPVRPMKGYDQSYQGTLDISIEYLAHLLREFLMRRSCSVTI